MKIIRVPKGTATPAGPTPYGLVFVTPDVIDGSKTYRGILMAHGIGQRGDGSGTNVEGWLTAECQNLLAIINGGNHIMVAPELYFGEWWSDPYGDYAYQQLLAKYKIDSKVFMLPVSLGGQLAWSWGGNNAEKLAGILACCAVHVNAHFENIKCPVIGFSALDDTTVFTSQCALAINAINDYKPPVPAKLLTYPTGGHSIWNTVYADPIARTFLGASVTASAPISTTTTSTTPTMALKADASATVTTVSGTTGLLDGSRSTGYKTGSWPGLDWELVSSPAGSWDVFDTPNFSKNGVLVKLKNLVKGTYVFKLTATDVLGNKATTQVSINVGAAAPAKTEFLKFSDNGKTYTIYDDKTWVGY